MSTNGWLEDAFSLLVSEATDNNLTDFPGVSIFGRPIMGVAAGEDEIFEVFRSVVGPRHLQPRDVLRNQSPAQVSPCALRVVSWALPFSPEIRSSNRGREWPSELYSVARNNGAALIHDALSGIVQIIHEKGFAAVAPAQTDEYDAFRSPESTFSSTWSERHVAYAAGLGRFGLNGCLMTPLGTSVRLTSLVTDLPLNVMVKNRACYQAHCLEDGGKDCGLCLERCPVRAISEVGLDKFRCYERRQAIRKNLIEPYRKKFHLRPSPIIKSGRRESGFSLGCALCMSAVPCESAIYPAEKNTR